METPPMKVKIHSNKTKFKMRKARINLVSNNYFNGNQISPSYNTNACRIMDEYGKKNVYNFQHAMNGGQFYIKQLGYWVDGINHNNKIIFEYYENFHKNKPRKDKNRINEIKNFMKYSIIIMKECTDKIEVVK